MALESPERNARGPNHLADPPEGWRLLVKSISLPSFPCFVFISDSSILIIDSFARFGPSIRDPSSVASAWIPRQETDGPVLNQATGYRHSRPHLPFS